MSKGRMIPIVEQTDKPNNKKGKTKNKRKPFLFNTNKAFFLYRPNDKIKNKRFSFQSALNTISKEKHMNDQMTEKMIKNSNEAVKKQRSKKKRWISAVLFIVNVLIVIAVIAYNFLTGEPISFSELLLLAIDWKWVLIALLMFFLYQVVDSFRTFVLIKSSTGKNRFWLSYKSTSICKFYDCATPLATGGQPFQVFYLNKRGMSASSSTSVPVARYMFSQITTVIFVSIILFSQYANLANYSTVIVAACWIGYALNFGMFLCIVFLSTSKKIAPACASGILKFLAKIHVIKDYRRTFLKVMRVVKEYIAITRQFISNFWVMLGSFLSSLTLLLIQYSYPFIIFCMLTPGEIQWEMWFPMLTLAIICEQASSFIPLPGGTGGAEVSFMFLFATYFDPTNSTIWAMLIWRLLTYYGNLLQGLGIMFYDFVWGNKKIGPLLEKYKEEDLIRQQKLIKSKKVKGEIKADE